MNKEELRQHIENIIMMTCQVYEPSYSVHDVSLSIIALLDEYNEKR